LARNRKLVVGSHPCPGSSARRRCDGANGWLIDPTPYRRSVTTNANELVLQNGLARRVIRLAPNAATVELQNLTSGEHLLRAIAPEARVTINGTEYAVGGLKGQPIANYIKAEWLDQLTADPRALPVYRLEPGSDRGAIRLEEASRMDGEGSALAAQRQTCGPSLRPPAGVAQEQAGRILLRRIFVPRLQ